ncbi:MAG: hypothetical protein ABI835_17885 [Chloroflexota bacterium]
MNQLGAVERRRRNLRIGLFSVILGTLPLYCLGFLLWGTAPNRNVRTPTAVTTSISTLQTSATRTLPPTLTPFQFPTQNVPTQIVPQFTFNPPTAVIPPTIIQPTATNFIFPTSTIAPTLTFLPTFTTAPTETPIPIPTLELPTITSIPTATATETPTETATYAEPPTPIPFDNP